MIQILPNKKQTKKSFGNFKSSLCNQCSIMHDQPRIIHTPSGPSIQLREEGGILVLGPHFSTVFSKVLSVAIPLLVAVETVLFIAIFLLIFNQYKGDSFQMMAITGLLLGSIIPVGLAASYIWAKIQVKNKTRLIILPNQIVVKDSQLHDITIEKNQQVTFSCKPAFDTDGRELHDVFLQCSEGTYYILSGYESNEMETLCSLLNDTNALK